VVWWVSTFRRLFCPEDVVCEVLLVPIYQITRCFIPRGPLMLNTDVFG